MSRYLSVRCKDLCLECSFWIPRSNTLILFSSLHVSHIFTWNIHTREYENTIFLPHHRVWPLLISKCKVNPHYLSWLLVKWIGCYVARLNWSSHHKGHWSPFFIWSFTYITPLSLLFHLLWVVSTKYVCHFWFVKHSPILRSIHNHLIGRLTFGTPKVTNRKSCHIIDGDSFDVGSFVQVNNNTLQDVYISIWYPIPSIFV